MEEVLWPVTPDAARRAQLSATSAGIDIRLVDTVDGFRAVSALLNEIWGVDPARPILPKDVIRALAFSGHYVAAAEIGGRLAGAAVGFIGSDHVAAATGDAPYHLHSHIAGVAPWARRRRVALALKLHQRQWALDHGLQTIGWTFDPLVRRNAMFNLGRLGARPTRYIVDFYGPQNDAVNHGGDSDRLYVEWDLSLPGIATHQPVHDATAPATNGDGDGDASSWLDGLPVLDIGTDGGPLLQPHELNGEAHHVLLACPEDIETFRTTDPERAQAWRAAMRKTLGEFLTTGYQVVGVTSLGRYLLASPPAGDG